MATRPGTDGAAGSLEVDMVFSPKRGNTRPPGRCSQWVGKRWGRKALTWAGDDCNARHGPGRASGTEAGGASGGGGGGGGGGGLGEGRGGGFGVGGRGDARGGGARNSGAEFPRQPRALVW